jgi:hypothetical protein
MLQYLPSEHEVSEGTLAEAGVLVGEVVGGADVIGSVKVAVFRLMPNQEKLIALLLSQTLIQKRRI